AEKLEKDNERLEAVLSVRNRYVTEQLQKINQRGMPNGALLKVFCVSNRHYSALKGTIDIPGEKLSAQGTGIPSLRAYALSLPSQGLLRHIEAYLHGDFTTVVDTVNGLAQREFVKNRNEVLEAISKPQTELGALLEQYRAELNKAAQSLVVNPLGTLRAFCRKKGNNRTSVKPQQSWNEDLTRPADRVLSDGCRNLHREQEEITKRYVEMLKALIDRILHDLQERFSGVLEGQAAKLISEQEKLDGELNKEFANIQMDMIYDGPTGYFREIMIETYNECHQIRGRGTLGRIIAALASRLSLLGENSPFSLLGLKIASILKQHIDRRCARLQSTVTDVLKRIKESFEAMTRDRIEGENLLLPSRKEAVELAQLAQLEMRALKEELAELKSSYEK
ncbi:hypothetical protein LTR28_007733, partial [Elasticomyces elasticus]